MNITEAIAQHKKAIKENSKAQAAAKAATETARAKWDAVRINRTSLFEKGYKTSPEYISAMEASEAETKARQAANIAQAIEKAAAHNVLNVAANTLQAAIIADPAKFSKPCHYKQFTAAILEVTGDQFYIDNSLSYSFYIRYRGLNYNDCIYIADKDGEKLNINPEKMTANYSEYTLKEIKTEAKKAIKDAEKLRQAAAKLEKVVKETRNNYKTYIRHYLPDYNSGNFKNSNLF